MSRASQGWERFWAGLAWVAVALQIVAGLTRAVDGDWNYALTHWLAANCLVLWRLEVAWRRKAQAKAWQNGFFDGREDVFGGTHSNPYRRSP